MDALTLIKENMTDEVAVELLASYGFDTTIRGRQIRSHCEIHGGDNASSFCYSLNNHMYYCHRCHSGGDVIQLAEHMERLDFVEACNKILGALGIGVEGLSYIKRNNNYEKELKAFIQYAKRGETKIAKYELPVEPRMVKMYRKFTTETLEHFELGFLSEMTMEGSNGQFKANNRLSMPILFNEEVVGYAFRRQKNTDNPKWLFQPYGLNKREILYHLKKYWYEEVIICEGIYDVWAWWQSGFDNVVCVLGSTITDEQVRLLQRVTANLTLSFDGDEAGRKATHETIVKLRNIFDIKVVQFQGGTDPSDNMDNLEQLHKEKIGWQQYLKQHGLRL